MDLWPHAAQPGRQRQAERGAGRDPARVVDLLVQPGETINRAPSPSRPACTSPRSETNVVANSSGLH